MSIGPRYRVPFRRRREGRTDYRVRLKLLKGGTTRAVVRFSHHRVEVALVDYAAEGDRVVAQATSSELARLGFPPTSGASTPAAYLTGYLAGLRAKSQGSSEAILDLGLRRPTPGGRALASLKGLLDAGIEIPHGETRFPEADRLNGTHLPQHLPEPIEIYKGKLPTIVAREGKK
ncbi:MAG: 50S ribosomal protein L18 [Candidatus Thermoplasmatota archaeon]|jgi:large subunit ribosomal protein L18|nr:50S ribosomal protein L18 [Candidatus Thermoplasmatota archaeon]